MRLYGYWRSSTSYRVRIALNLKGVAYETIPVDLARGAQDAVDYTALNPGGGVPTLVTCDGTVLVQSMAIVEWLDETHPNPALLPEGATARARVRAAALAISTDIHPVNNLRVIKRLEAMGHDEAQTVAWMNSWMTRGLSAFARMIPPDMPFSFGETPGLADLCLIPQLYNARRWGCDLAPFSRLTDIEARSLALAAFDAACPENQPDAP